MTALDQIITHGRSLGACPLLDEVHTLCDLCALLFTPQGREFCQRQAYPLEADILSLGREALARYRVFITSQAHVNPERIAFVGADTLGEITITDPKHRHIIVLMHGASLRLEVCAYAVVVIVHVGARGAVDATVHDTATIIYE